MNVHIYPSPFTNETRILKIVRSLRGHGVFDQILVIARRKDGLPGHEVLEDGIAVTRVAPLAAGGLPGGIGRVIKAIGWYAGVLGALRGQRVQCVNCHSLPVLPLCVLIKWWKSCTLVYEPHELETETAGLRGARQLLARWTERLLVRLADAVCVVNGSIARWYQATYALPSPHVVRNVPLRAEAPPARTGLLRAAIGLGPEQLLFLYQGLLAPGRGIEPMIRAFSPALANKHLVFMGYGELTPLIQKACAHQANIHFLPAVPPDQVQRYTADADVGLSLIEDVCLSYRLCLPNKLFEYAACGVPTIVSDFPEMAAFVQAHHAGWCIEPSAEALATLVASLDPARISSRRSQARAAGASVSWQDEESALLAMYRGLGFPPRSEAPGGRPAHG